MDIWVNYLTNKHYIEIDKNDSTNYIIFKNLNNETAKISNTNLIDGYLKVNYFRNRI